jgi:Carbon-nitrogen hydrolase
MSNEIKVSSKLDSFKLALAQVNPAVGDIDGNLRKERAARTEAAAKGADLIAFTELYLTGYPIEDLVLKPALQAAREACEAFARDTRVTVGPRCSLGFLGRKGRSSTTPSRIWIRAASRLSGSNTIFPKRRQAAPGVKITSKNFGRDRR